MSADSNPVVSVVIITYNQDKYIKEAIDSVLSQKTSFEFEVLIGDDGSTDGTSEILRSYSKVNGLKVFTRDREDWDRSKYIHSARRNLIKTIFAASGKYVALLEGDDYWIDDLKLQKQVDFLESHPNCVSCHHWQRYGVYDMDTYSEITAPINDQGYLPEKISTVKNIFSNTMRVKTRTHMFRNVLSSLPDWFYKVGFGDVPLSMVLGKHGDFGFLDEEMAVYRQTKSGISTKGLGERDFILGHYLKWIEIWEQGNNYFHDKYWPESKATIRQFIREIVIKYFYSVRILIQLTNYFFFRSQLSGGKRAGLLLYVLGTYLKRKLNVIMRRRSGNSKI